MPLADFLLDTIDRYRDVVSTTTDDLGIPVTTVDPSPVTYPAQVRLAFAVTADQPGSTTVTGDMILDGSADVIETDRIVHNGVPYRVVGVDAISSRYIGPHLKVRLSGEVR